MLTLSPWEITVNQVFQFLSRHQLVPAGQIGPSFVITWCQYLQFQIKPSLVLTATISPPGSALFRGSLPVDVMLKPPHRPCKRHIISFNYHCFCFLLNCCSLLSAESWPFVSPSVLVIVSVLMSVSDLILSVAISVSVLCSVLVKWSSRSLLLNTELASNIAFKSPSV